MKLAVVFVLTALVVCAKAAPSEDEDIFTDFDEEFKMPSMPDIKFPEIHMPRMPDIKFPEIKMPKMPHVPTADEIRNMKPANGGNSYSKSVTSVSKNGKMVKHTIINDNGVITEYDE